MSQFRAIAQSQLDALARESGVRGALLVSRDGLPVLTAGRLADPGMIAAMTATMLGAAEMAVPDPGPLRIRVEADTVRLVAVPATRDSLLVLLGEPSGDAEEQLAQATAAADAIAAATTTAVKPAPAGRIGWAQEPTRRTTAR